MTSASQLRDVALVILDSLRTPDAFQCQRPEFPKICAFWSSSLEAF